MQKRFLRKVINISRPRFWVYLLGTFFLGLFFSGAPLTSSLTNPLTYLLALYFSLPANLLIYGVNDVFDYETDKLNTKKGGYEELVRPNSHKLLTNSILGLNIPFLALIPFLPSMTIFSMFTFLFFGIFYSAKPIRAKTKPFLDAFFNILYIFPVYAGHFLDGHTSFTLAPLLAGICWVMAMHAYSAIPDIHADTKAGLATIATVLNKNGTLLFCALMYLASGLLVIPYIGVYAILLAALYLAIMVFSAQSKDIMSIYRYFPAVNTASGMTLTLIAILQLL
ncbi:MAG: prenyltransferase [bacterium]|nr:prenyltransferase [bacterium]MDA1024339.1 prenyltransferase [bacterium]